MKRPPLFLKVKFGKDGAVLWIPVCILGPDSTGFPAGRLYHHAALRPAFYYLHMAVRLVVYSAPLGSVVL